MSDRAGGPPSGQGRDGQRRGHGMTSRRNATWAFLPSGVTFLVLGLALGLGKGAGTTFFIIGISFLTIALAGGERDRDEGGSSPPPPQEPPPAD